MGNIHTCGPNEAVIVSGQSMKFIKHKCKSILTLMVQALCMLFEGGQGIDSVHTF